MSEAPASLLPPLTAARDAAVVCDLTPLAVIAVAGPDAATFLQGQLSADVTALAEDACGHASLNSPKGRMLANFVLWRAPGDGGFRLLVPADIAPGVQKRLSMYVLRSKVALRDASAETALIGVGGARGRDALVAALGNAPEAFRRLRAGETVVLGLPGPRYVIVAPPAAADELRAALTPRAVPAPYACWEWLSIRAGVPMVTAATQDLFVAQTANWDLLRGIDFKKGCYTGQEIIARTQYLGRLKERTFLFHVDDGDPRPGARLYGSVYGDQPCGTVVNAAPSPGGGYDLLAVVQIAAAERNDLRLDAPDGPALAQQPLPYAMPPAAAPRGRSV